MNHHFIHCYPTDKLIDSTNRITNPDSNSSNCDATNCVSCGKYIYDKGIRVNDYVYLCEACNRNLVKFSDCRWIVDFIKQYYLTTPIGLITGWKLKVSPAERMRVLGGSERIRGLAYSYRYGRNYMVYIYRFLSKVTFGEVLAHELLHIWQYQQKIKTSQLKSEGFCELGAYLMLDKIGNNEAKFQMNLMYNNPDVIYGEGLRLMLDIFYNKGWQGVIDYLTQS